MNKKPLFELLLSELNTSLKVAIKAANDARDLATHEQSKPETQYDTVGLEASYLAHGQSQRVNDLQLAIEDWQRLQLKQFDDESSVSAGALVKLAGEACEFIYLIGNYSGGLKLNLNGQHILIISILSPIGEQLSEKQIGDEITSPIAPNKYLEIIEIV